MTPYLAGRINLCRTLLETDPDNFLIGQIPEGTTRLPAILEDYPLYGDFLRATNGPQLDVTILLRAEELTDSHTLTPVPFPGDNEEWLYIGSTFYIPIGIEKATQHVHIQGANEGVYQQYDSFDVFAEQLFDRRYLDIVVVDEDQWSAFLDRNGLL